MTDDEIMDLAHQAGWSGCDPAVREKLLKFGKLIVRRKNQHKHIYQEATKQENKLKEPK